MNRIATKANEVDEIVYQPKDDRWREAIDLGIYNIGMTTIISPKYNLNDDMKQHYEYKDEEHQSINDQGNHLPDNDHDNNDIEAQNDEPVTYNESCLGQLEADLDETRSDFKLIVCYLMETDEKFRRHHEDIAVSHKSIATFINTVHQKDSTLENEMMPEKSVEQNMPNEESNGDFIPVINKRKKKNRKKNKNNRKKGSWGSTMINGLGIGSGNITSEDSASSTGAEEDYNAILKSSHKETMMQNFQKAKA